MDPQWITLLKNVPAYKNVTEELEKVTRELEKVKKKYMQLKRQDKTTNLWQAIKTYRQELMQQVINISKVQGPRGHPGYNGTQGPSGVPGPPGYNGTRGPPSDSGSGGLSLSSYKETKGPTASPSAYASSEVTATDKMVKNSLVLTAEQSLQKLSSSAALTQVAKEPTSVHVKIPFLLEP